MDVHNSFLASFLHYFLILLVVLLLHVEFMAFGFVGGGEMSELTRLLSIITERSFDSSFA